MHLYLLRHAIAVEPGTEGAPTDFDRRLTPGGVKKFRRAVRGMKGMSLEFDAILSSPYPRARETADLVRQGLGGPEVRETANLAPDGAPANLIQELKQFNPPPERVLLVGHEPFLSGLASLLISGTRDVAIRLKKGGLIHLEAAELQPGRCAELRSMVGPAQLKLMG
jgi:phosphohistidine phosphatase